MNIGQVVGQARLELDDVVEPYLWSSGELYGHANDVLNLFYDKTRIISDSSTVGICHIDVLPDTSEYDLDPRVLFIESARIAGVPLLKRERDWMDINVPDWRTATGAPTCYVVDYEAGKLWVYPVPVDSVSLDMTVTRLPLEVYAVNTPNATLEISVRYHPSIVKGILWKAYLKRDSQTFDQTASDANKALLFEEIENCSRNRIVRQSMEKHIIPTNIWR